MAFTKLKSFLFNIKEVLISKCCTKNAIQYLFLKTFVSLLQEVQKITKNILVDQNSRNLNICDDCNTHPTSIHHAMVTLKISDYRFVEVIFGHYASAISPGFLPVRAKPNLPYWK